MNRREGNEFRLGVFLSEHQALIYPLLFYLAGVILATAVYQSVRNTDIHATLQPLLQTDGTQLLPLIFHRLGVYLTVFSVSVVLGMCLIGFPVLNLIPLFCGFVIALKVAYYYATYGARGIGYCILMVIPEAAAFEAVLIFTLIQSSRLSKRLMKETVKKSDMTQPPELKSYLKRYLLYFVLTVLIALINASLIYCLGGIIHL